MKPTKEQIEANKEMAKASPDSMKAMIEENLKATCDKFPGNEDKLDGCIDYLTKCAKEILGGKNGEVDNETCYRICRDYFNDEIWKKKEAAEKKAAKKAASEAKKKAAEEKNAAAEARKAEIARQEEAEEEAKMAELERMKAEAAREAEAMKADSIKPEPVQLDFFAIMGV